VTSLASDTQPRPRSPRLELDALELDTWGVVFCGGQSLRMGRDKARLELDGRPLLSRAVETLQTIAPRVLLASGERERYGELELECVLDAEPGCGPLSGLAAVLERARAAGVSWVLVLACDMPYADARVFEALLARARTGAHDAVLLATPSGVEPLFAVYHVRVLGALRSALARGERRMNSFHADVRLATLSLAELGDDPLLRAAACNLNTPQEFTAEGGVLN